MKRADAYTAIAHLRATLDDAAGQITDLLTAANAPTTDTADVTPPTVVAAVGRIDAVAGVLDDLIQTCRDAESRTFRDGL